MRDTIQLRCDECGKVHHYNSHFIKGVLKGMKMDKAREVAHQMHEKRGPFYDKWLVAMEIRGEQKRCKTCDALEEDDNGFWCMDSKDYGVNQNPGAFACSKFEPKR